MFLFLQEIQLVVKLLGCMVYFYKIQDLKLFCPHPRLTFVFLIASCKDRSLVGRDGGIGSLRVAGATIIPRWINKVPQYSTGTGLKSVSIGITESLYCTARMNLTL